ncbi:MAG: aminodeoxychorismate synthase component I [Deltaproteobacteria bacterium]|jgi:para-aminobenzoate synthetase component 1|nr:aminodeoxychorismate synthase component I [Deltaproteobacteria bacterium]
METLDAQTLRERMNGHAGGREPFLFAVDFELGEGIIATEPFADRDLLFSVRGRGNGRGNGPGNVGPGLSPAAAAAGGRQSLLEADLMPFHDYLGKFMVVRRGLLRGDSFLVNLTVRTPIRVGLGLEDIFYLSDAPYSLCVPGRFCCFSPETFVTIKGGVIATHPMKGTIDASLPDAEGRILSDFKESAEHATIVDLLRNDLGVEAERVSVTRYRYIDRLRTSEREILQVSSEIRGSLGEGWKARLGDLVFGMLPAGSCSGAPKLSTLGIIREAEGEPRGYYTGVFGLFDGEDLDSGVLIRFVEERDGSTYFRSGGGITAFSRPQDEYREVMEKIYLPFAGDPKKAR